MICASCGFASADGARFCGGCGAGLRSVCPHCASAIPFDVRFCTSCGQSIAPSPEEQPATDPTSAAERRRVSVLFVDLENFTPLAETLDPEEVRTLLSRYFEAARRVVALYGGTIEKFIGDAVMAVWGAPVAHEDDAERAVSAAAELVKAVAVLGGAAAGKSLTARAGVTSGEAAVTVGARGQGMVAGDLVNTASRLQAMAPSGGVLVDLTTRDRARHAAVFDPVGPLTLKGRSEPLTAFRLAADQPVGAAPGHGPHTGPFVGRDRELRELTELFEAAARDRQIRLVSVTGIAGIGKSRLAWEFGEYTDTFPGDVAWHAGQAPAYGGGGTFTPIAEMVRRRIRIPDGADPELTRRQLESALPEIVRDDAERHWMEARLAVLLGLETEDAFDRDELFAAWRRFFERVSDFAPAVLLFEDLQWADPSLLDFIEHLATWARGHRILILTLARPELLDRHSSWGGGLRSFTSIHLEALPDSDMRNLLAGRAPDLSDGIIDQILEHAGGVPLYAVEVVRILADREAAAPSTDRRAAPRLEAVGHGSISVPDSLHGLIAARIDALPPTERRLLLAAAVLGRRFRPEALVAAAGTEPGLAREHIDDLVRRELLGVDNELNSPGYGELGFVQDLVREVAYQTLALSERRGLHLAAARFLESLPDDEPAESLADHLVEAHRLAPEHPDAPRLARRAISALRRAAHVALRLHVAERAVGQLEQALRLAETAEQRTMLLQETAGAAAAAGRLELAEQHLRELIDLQTRAGKRIEAARTRAQLASVLLTAQRNEQALVELEAATGAVRRFSSDPAGVELTSQLARGKMLAGDDRAGLEWAQRALTAARRLHLDVIAADALVTRGTARFRLGDEEAGLADLHRAIAEAETGEFLAVELRARNNVAWLVVTDDPQVTLATARQGIELATTMGVGDIAVQFADVACTVAVDTGDWDWALTTVAEVEQRPVSDAFRISLAASASIIHALRGDEDGLTALRELEPFPPRIDTQVLAAVDYARAWAAFIDGGLEDCRRLAREGAERSFGAERARHLALATRASLWLHDTQAARADLARLEGLRLSGRAVEAAAATLAAGVAALGGEEAARQRYRAAAQAWEQLDVLLHRGLCLLDEHLLLDGGKGPTDALAILRNAGADGLLRAAGVSESGRAAGPPRRAGGRRPSERTDERSDAGHRRRRATGPATPPG